MKNLFNIILCKILGHHYIDKGFKMVERGKLFDCVGSLCYREGITEYKVYKCKRCGKERKYERDSYEKEEVNSYGCSIGIL
jgi:hypothetical protein